jgi:hypothetical protein
MSKHPGPWRLDQVDLVRDAQGNVVCRLTTPDPETRIKLLHAAEMWEDLKYWAAQKGVAWDVDDVIDSIAEDVNKIKTEIAAARKP